MAKQLTKNVTITGIVPLSSHEPETHQHNTLIK